MNDRCMDALMHEGRCADLVCHADPLLPKGTGSPALEGRIELYKKVLYFGEIQA